MAMMSEGFNNVLARILVDNIEKYDWAHDYKNELHPM